MTLSITRKEAIDLLRNNIQTPGMFNHCLASEAVLRSLARKLDKDEELWGIAGLVHDLDAETHPDLSVHTLETARILSDLGVASELIEAVRLHNEQAHGEKRTTLLQHALAAGETVTGLITAAALVHPDKKLASVKQKSVRKRFKEAAFARGADRTVIAECTFLGIEINDFLDLALEAMQAIADDIGL